ncbi:MAG TPA: hypothetical protein PK096_00985 [Candidatus Saccharibacteria bacterium]|nr:hypothetical protein [Candidatus Saccharibacteria bacterium]HRK93925.1 hypothetical protein [Candidatus Saccharibacteria bacterium]
MPYTQANPRFGFTLVEVLVISPVIILFIGAFIGLVVNLTGESLVLKEKNAVAYNSQAALDEMERTVSQATGFLASTGTLTSPQGKNDDTTAFTNDPASEPDVLIIRAAATTAGPFSSSRSLIYTGAGSCDYKNPIYQYTAIYFVKNGSLYKRTIVVPTAACASPWQRNTCTDTLVAANPTVCKTDDEKLLDNVTNLSVQYYSSGSSTQALAAADATQASAVSITITTSKNVAGSAVSNSSSLRVTSLNAQAAASDNSQPPVANPAITYAWNDTSSPYKTTFSWQAIGNATGYNIRYRLNGGSWVNGPQGTTATTYDITGTHRKQTIEIEVTAVSSSGNFLYGTATATIPRWTTCNIQAPWQNFDAIGTGYTEAGFTKTTTQMVGLKGMIKSGTVGYSATNTYRVCTLPAGFRPMSRQIFLVNSYNAGLANGRGYGRVDVDVDGSINVVAGNNVWVSLDGIIFATSGSSISWSNPVTSGTSFANGWNYNNYGGEDYGTPRYGLDTLGRVWFEGLATQGTVNASILAALPSSVRPAQAMHVPADAGTSNPVGMINIGYSGAGDTYARAVNSYRSMQFVYYPGATAPSWKSLNLSTAGGNWSNYGSIWTTAQCFWGSDDIVVVKGLITGGSTTYPAVIANLPSSTGGSCGAPNADGTLLMPAVAAPDYIASIDLTPGGSMQVTNANSTWTSLDGFHFIAD